MKNELQKETENYEYTKDLYQKLQQEMKSIMERADWLKDCLEMSPESSVIPSSEGANV